MQTLNDSIRPEDIGLFVENPLRLSFGDSTIEATAETLVRFAQKRGDWVNFTQTEIDAFAGESVDLSPLMKMPYPCIKQKGQHYAYTRIFIATCHDASRHNVCA